jgi:hypothetical protein
MVLFYERVFSWGDLFVLKRELFQLVTVSNEQMKADQEKTFNSNGKFIGEKRCCNLLIQVPKLDVFNTFGFGVVVVQKKISNLDSCATFFKCQRREINFELPSCRFCDSLLCNVLKFSKVV